MGNYVTPAGDADYVELAAAGSPAKGEFHCAECGYGVTVTRVLPACPMCTGSSWQRSDWAPMQRASQLARRSELAGL